MRTILPLPDFSSAHLLVVGDVMLDAYCFGDTRRISPEAPVQIVRVQEEVKKLGAAANVAANVRELGARVSLIGLVGDDDDALVLESLLDQYGIEHKLVRVAGSMTVRKSRVVSRNQQLIRLDREDGFPHAPLAEIDALFDRFLPQADAVVLSDYAKGCLRRVPGLIQRARVAAKPVFVDPKRIDFSAYTGATVLTPNFPEFSAVAGGECSVPQAFEHAAEKLRHEIDLEALLVTRGSEGMVLVEKERRAVWLSAQTHEVYDATGAGDTVVSVLAASHTAGLNLSQSARLANLAAGLAVMKLGAAVITPAELAHAAAGSDSASGIHTQEELITLVRAARDGGGTIVMTNGCFDLLHAGHVEYLKQAALLGDKLIVAVNDDDSVSRLKGKGRPIRKLGERMLLLAALESVDWVVPFSEDTPENLVRRICPDVLAKGGDYRPEEVAGFDAVAQYNGKVVILDYVESCSTSELVARIRN